MRKYNYVIWDWNGTLFSDVNCAISVINRMLSKRNLPIFSTIDEYHKAFCFPIRDYYLRAGLSFEAESFEALAAEYMQDYTAASRECKLYSGAEEVMRELNNLGVEQLIVSASKQNNLQAQLDLFDIEKYLSAVLGIDNHFASGKEGLAEHWIEEKGIKREEILFIGDTTHDFEIANSLGCDCVLIANGHQSENTLQSCGTRVISDIREVLAQVFK